MLYTSPYCKIKCTKRTARLKNEEYMYKCTAHCLHRGNYKVYLGEIIWQSLHVSLNPMYTVHYNVYCTVYTVHSYLQGGPVNKPTGPSLA